VAADRETDRRETLVARRVAVRAVPVVGAIWLALVLVWSSNDDVVRIATIAALIAAVGVAARAAVTTVRFRRRWAPDLGAEAPPLWVTLVLVACAVAATVGWANVISDADADELDVPPVLLAAAFTAGTGLAAWRHLPGARSLTADLRPPPPADPEKPFPPIGG
jgi:drug/metabolite transporter (DMT)-like permease